MRSDELVDAGALSGTVLHDIATVSRDVHRSVSRRVFGVLGAPARPVRLVHDAVAGLSYGSARAGVRHLPALGARLAARWVDPRAASVQDSGRGRAITSALSGVLGDRMVAEQPSLAVPLTVRTHGGPRRTDPAGLVTAADATGDVVVFVHGLCERDDSWWSGARRHWGDPDVTFGSLLRDELGWTPLYLNYTSGRRISDSGRDVDRLLDGVVRGWPVPVRRLALVGHSMGGLVARSAAAQALQRADGAWLPAMRTVVCLGSPHLGAPLEQAVHRGARLMRRLPETAPFATLLDRRSAGIRDLRHGALLEVDWQDLEDAIDDPCSDVPLSLGVDHHVVGVTLTRSPDGPLARAVGDLLVPWSSSSGGGRPGRAGRRVAFDSPQHIGRLHHFDLLDHPAVYAHVRGWLR